MPGLGRGMEGLCFSWMSPGKVSIYCVLVLDPVSAVAVAAQLLGWVTFGFPAPREGVMDVGAQGVQRTNGSQVLALLTYRCFAPCSLSPLYNFGLDLGGTALLSAAVAEEIWMLSFLKA